ncbi:CapA family protein [Solwaraspora sp. WMMD1047]|uniref:CapA family protein n=1 Tax=Solwaraspora sp. WMMD1047 TaxID=3016102 RepID=UPI0024176F21|nr:CapA family protein [Solwaraspora sp. WMMD1047]MDG4828028.1 CapA family protein [Solwaraspora sp. WMMD1047]
MSTHADQAPNRPGRPRRRLLGRPALVLAAVVVLLVGLGVVGVAAAGFLRDEPPAPTWQAGSADSTGGTGQSAPTPSPTPADRAISMSATGDIVLGNAPNRLPANDGEGFFDSVRDALAADLVMGNLEEPLTEDTGTGKCGADSTRCFQFRAPPSYAKHLADAGFDLLNQANNHGYDFGAAGYRNTQQALERHDLLHTGAVDQITVTEVEGVKVAVAGFSSYAWNNSLVDIAAAEKVIEKATTMADLVVVQVHMGAEGSEMTRVKPGTELFLGENRGDPVKFSKAMIDAGADLIVGHGPHVLRGMEFYQGRLIAYSLGNFAGGGNMLSNNGRLGWGGVLKVELNADGSWAGGQFLSTYMNGAGKPTMDRDLRGLKLIQQLNRSDFPQTGAKLDAKGVISPPPAD